MPRPSHCYLAFGLAIESEIECPELRVGDGDTQISVSRGTIERPAGLDRHWYRTSDGGLGLVVPAVGTFEIREGNSILVDAERDASPESIRLFLLGSAFGALLHQRGILALHGSTVSSADACVSVLGDSGAGKSTTAAALRRAGFRLLTDDVSAVDVSDSGIVQVHPAYPQHKLWEDSLAILSIDPAQHARVLPEEEKRIVRVDQDFESSPTELSCIFVLEKGDVREPHFEPVRGSDKLSLLVQHTYRNYFLTEMRLLESHFKIASTVAKAVPLMRIIRPESNASIDAVVRGILYWSEHKLAGMPCTDPLASTL